MGNNQSFQYVVPVSEKLPGETQIFRCPYYKDGLVDGPEPHIKDMKTAFITAFKKNSET